MPKVFVNGCFDLLHPGHFNLLMYARGIATSAGKVVAALDHDEHIMVNKGYKRPIFTVEERAKAVLDLRTVDGPVVDEVEFFYTNTQLVNIIRRVKPDYILKGSDWRNKKVVGSEYAKVLFYERQPYSTTEIIKRVLDKHTILK